MTAGVGAGWALYGRTSLVGTVSLVGKWLHSRGGIQPFCSEVLCSQCGVNEGRF